MRTAFILAFLPSVVVAVDPYSEELAKKYLAFAGAAYCSESSYFNVTNWHLSPECEAMSPGFQVYNTYADPAFHAFGYIGFSSTDRLIAGSFKGTDPNYLVDWCVDLESLFFYTDPCTLDDLSPEAHKGFCGYYHSMRSQGFKRDLEALMARFPDYKVVLTGHSLGAAVAMLAAVDVMANNHTGVELYTYGQPRTGTAVLAQDVLDLLATELPRASYYRITHYKDVVAHLPPCSFWSGGNCTFDETHPYHTGYHIHYNAPMGSYQHCGTGDGQLCDEYPDLGVDDHLYYFGYRVSMLCCPTADGGEAQRKKILEEFEQRALPVSQRRRVEVGEGSRGRLYRRRIFRSSL